MTDLPNPERADQRKSFRCPVRPPRGSATLVIGRGAFSVRVLDESATGLAIQAAQDPGVKVGDVVRVRTEAGLHEARVAYLCEEGPAETAAASVDASGPTFRIGLERLRDLPCVDTEGPWYRRLSLARLIPSGAAAVGAACMLAVASVVVGVIAVVSVWPAHSAPARASRAMKGRSETPSTIDWIIQRQTSAPPRPTQPLRRDPTAAGSRQSAAEQDSPAKAAGLRGSGGPITGAVGRLPGAMPFARADVARQLGLDDAQKRRIQAIIEVTGDAERQIARQEDAGNRQEQAAQRAALLEEARRQALKVLTDPQRERWEAMQQ